MASPSLMVRILGDVAGLSSAFVSAGEKGKSAAAGIHSAFSGMLGTLNSTGVLGPFGNALQTADQSLQAMEGHAKKTSDKMIGLGGAAAGVGLGLAALGSKDQAAHQQLQASITATGHSYSQYGDQVEAAIKHQEKFGNTADDTQGALRVLTSATHDPTEALKLLNTTTDLAAAKHEDLTAAAGQVGKAYNGSARIFKEFGVVVTKNKDGTKDYHKAIGDLGTRLGGQASAQANTFNGHLKDMKAVITDHVSLFGQKYGPAIGTAGVALAGFGSAMKGAKAATDAMKDSQVIQGAVTKTATAIQWLFNAAMDANPILIVVIAIIAIIAILILLATHFKIIRDAVDDVWKFIKKAWDDILGIFQGVFNWIAANWPLLLAILTGPFGLAVYMIVTYWNNIVDFFKGIPGKITTAIGDVVNLLYDIGKTIINSLKRGAEDAWHAVEGFFSGVAKKVGNFLKNPLSIFSPSKVMMEQGKFIMQGLGLGITAGFDQHVQPALNATVAALTPARGGGVSAGAGALSPAMASSSSGPAVVVNNAHFSSGVDVDAFMRRAAWVARNRL
jgi:hypothetical protein